MRILFDQGTPVPLRKFLSEHRVETAYENGWSRLKNGELIDAAERAGFDLVVTTDTNLKYQQSLARRRIGVVVLKSASWPRIQRALSQVVETIDGASGGSYVEIEIP